MENPRDHSAEFRRCLIDCDVDGIRRLWAFVSPHLSQPKTEHEALVSIHHARTSAESVPLRHRAYSHRWLLERSYPSALPDGLKPVAERMYPRVVDGVGISVNTSSALFRPITDKIATAMSDAVMDAYADKRTEPDFVKARMAEARAKTVKQLIGVAGK